MSVHPIQFMCLVFAGLMNRRQQQVIDYLQGENRVLRAKLGPKRLRFNDAQRRKLARLGKRMGRKMLGRYAGLAHPDTILRWRPQDGGSAARGQDVRSSEPPIDRCEVRR